MKKWKKVLSMFVAISLLVIFTAGCGNSGSGPASSGTAPTPDASAPAPEDNPVELRMSFPNPVGSPTEMFYQYFAEAVHEESGGSVTIITYPAASLIADADAPDALFNKQVELCHATVSNLSPTIKELTPLELPGIFRSDRHMEFAYILHPIINEICEPYGIKQVFPAAGGPAGFISKKGFITDPSDLQGMTVRTSGRWIGEAMRLWGGSPVTMPQGDIPTALERNTVDAVFSGGSTTIAPFRLYELADYVTYTMFQVIYTGMFMTLDSWNSLSPAQQAAFDRAVDRVIPYSEEIVLEFEDAYIQDYLDYGAKFYNLSDEENQKFFDIAITLTEDPELLELAGDLGKKLIDVCAELRAGYDKPYQPGVKPQL